ncbi:hypothetical protein BVG16_17160 [Paenibacillus selenitireducens]|uniref:AB hydrolase-1 domain-containing protein n=1 Tax=Paenibacillus selenitireducens TaxID=1324314 RepID=A0A1T2XAF5_9BACL|nr:alpha/beta hydrolase [Paenibacillus selenitireducens]OPA76879.1 hypothetical protein BVG16_17160 [Paenibacillus selenitireducens]
MRSIFRNQEAELAYERCYEESLTLFELAYSSCYVKTSFGDTHVVCFGDRNKKPLMLLHGMTMSSTMWYPNVKHWVQDRCVYAIDVMGDFGRSKPAGVMKSRREARQWLLEVLDGLSYPQVDLAGHSMGGFLSLNFALAYPELVSRLMLYAPAGTFHRVSFQFFTKIYPALLFHTENRIDRAFQWFSASGAPLLPVFRSQVIAGYRNAKPLLRVTPTVFSSEEFENFRTPTLLLVGDQEVIYPAKRAIANAQEMIPHVKGHLITGASHALTIENADIINTITLDFLKQHDTANRLP